MVGGNGKEGRLVSWKEIAAFLGVDERTCQRWEKKFGLPVKRLEDAAKSRVFADRADLERWRASAFKDGASIPEADGRGSPSAAAESQGLHGQTKRPNAGRIRLLVAALILTAAGAAGLLSLPSFDRQPVDFRFEAPFFVALNKHGRELWRFDTQLADLGEEVFTRRVFQRPYNGASEFGIVHRSQPLLLMEDLDGDGRNETLYAPVSREDKKVGRIHRFDSKGRLVWTFDANTGVKAGGIDYPPDSVIQGISTEDLDGDGRPEILAVSHIRMSSPCRVFILNLDGTLRSDYWHFGQISDLAVRDLDDDGKPEILCCGQVNGDAEGPCFFILDPRRMRGAAPALGPRSRLEGLPDGTELVAALLPLTPLERQHLPGVAATTIDVLKDGRFLVTVDIDAPVYEFDRQGRLITVTLGHEFQKTYKKAFSDGRLSEPPDFDRFRRELMGGLRYYDGKSRSWVRRFARSNPR